jgi:hypothetical protein
MQFIKATYLSKEQNELCFDLETEYGYYYLFIKTDEHDPAIIIGVTMADKIDLDDRVPLDKERYEFPKLLKHLQIMEENGESTMEFYFKDGGVYSGQRDKSNPSVDYSPQKKTSLSLLNLRPTVNFSLQEQFDDTSAPSLATAEDYSSQQKSDLSALSLTLIGGFIAVIGIMAVALAFTVLAIIPPAAAAVGTLGGLAATFGFFLVMKGVIKKCNEKIDDKMEVNF